MEKDKVSLYRITALIIKHGGKLFMIENSFKFLTFKFKPMQKKKTKTKKTELHEKMGKDRQTERGVNSRLKPQRAMRD